METLNPDAAFIPTARRLCEPAMLDLTRRLIAIPSENPPGNHHEGCAPLSWMSWTDSASMM